jgi:Glycosyltransferase family 87
MPHQKKAAKNAGRLPKKVGMLNKNKLLLYFIPLALLLAYALRHSLHAPASDFAGYYYGSRELLTGHYQHAYDMQTLNNLITGDGYKGVFVSYAPFPPFTSLVLAPFLLFPMGMAKVIFNLVCAAFFVFSLIRSCRYFSIPPFLTLLIPVVFFIPIFNNLAFGQSYLLLCCLLLEGFRAYREQSPILSSFLWGLAILFKLFPAFLFLFLLLRKKYRETLFLAIACGLLLLPSLWLNGLPAWKYYVSEIAPKMGRGELNDSWTYIFQSAFMLLKRTFLYDGLLNPHPLLNNPYLFVIGMALFKALILSPAVSLTLRNRDDFFSFSVWVMASMLISPNGSSYSLVLLVIPLLALGSLPRISPSIPSGIPPGIRSGISPGILIAILVLVAACTIPVSRFGSFPIWAQFPRLYLLLLFFILLLSRGNGGLVNAGLVAVIALAFFALDIRGYLPSNETSAYVLTKEQHLFICDYTVRDNKLVYYYQDDSGVHEQPTDYVVHDLTSDGVKLQDNQIWYKGKKLTDSPDRKEKVAVVDGKDIFYLSDKNRGVGFFTLRELPAGVLPAVVMQDAAAIPVSSR